MASLQFIILLTLGIICIAAAIFLTFKPKAPAAVVAYIGMILLHFSAYIYLATSTLIFWLAAAIIIGILFLLRPLGEPKESKISDNYIALGGFAGLLVGMAVDARLMVLSLIIGTIFGLIIYSKTPAGRWLKFPTLTFIQYFCAKGLPAIVAIAIIGIAAQGFLVK